MSVEQPKYVKRTHRLSDWFPNSIGIAHFGCIRCGSQIGIGGYFSKPATDTKVVWPCSACTTAHYRRRGLAIKWVNGKEVLVPIPIQEIVLKL